MDDRIQTELLTCSKYDDTLILYHPSSVGLAHGGKVLQTTGTEHLR